MKEGFYKLDEGSLLYAPNFVSGPGVNLEAINHNEYIYPVAGWHWFDTLTQACTFFGLNETDYLPTITE